MLKPIVATEICSKIQKMINHRVQIKKKQAMMTLQGMADHRFTSVSLSTNVFLGEIIFSP